MASEKTKKRLFVGGKFFGGLTKGLAIGTGASFLLGGICTFVLDLIEKKERKQRKTFKK